MVERTECDSNNSTVEVMHSVNLAVLQSLYDAGNISLTGVKFNKPASQRDAQSLKSPIFGDVTDTFLAADEGPAIRIKSLLEAVLHYSCTQP